MPAPSSRHRRRRRLPAIALAGAAALALGACTSTPKPAGVVATHPVDHQQPAPSTPSAAPAPAARIAMQPASGSANVVPTEPVMVWAAAGTLTKVAVTSSDGKQVSGSLSADRTQWISAEPLGYGLTYSVAATAANADGKPARLSAAFTTVTPANFTLPDVFPTPDIGTVGIGQPITVHFDEPVADRAAAERSLVVTANPPTQGAWYWFDDQNVHWRPRTYWVPGTKVAVHANVYGVNVGGGIYGQQDVATSFTIGPSRVATVDDRTHQMAVRINGKLVRTIPVSMGRGGTVTVGDNTINLTTQSGPHVVQEKLPVVEMKSSTFGLPVNSPLGYDTKVSLAVRISGSGEYVHSAPWSVADQGVDDVSHGCVNVSPANAQWFYDTFNYGDVVDIQNTGLPLARGDKYGDWMIPWTEWSAGGTVG